jgi:acylphosphatase
MSGEHICRQARISGRVQMVWFRAWTVGEAEKRGISGWVRNRKDGSVEALFSGAADAVEAMISACREGPGHRNCRPARPSAGCAGLSSIGDGIVF